MEKTSTLVNNIYTNAKEYIGLKTRSLKLEAYDKAAGAAAGAVNGAILAVLGLCAFLFLNVGVAYWLSEVFNSTKLGFLTLGGIYVVLIGIFLAVKKSIDTSIKNTIVKKMSSDAVTDYEGMIKEKITVNAQLERAETVVKGNIEELKDNIDTLVQDFKKLKEDVQRFRHLFGHHDHDGSQENGEQEHSQNGHQNNHMGSGFVPKLAMSTIIEFLINKFVLKNTMGIKKALIPILAKAFFTSKMMKSDGAPPKEGDGFLAGLKSKLSKFL